MSYPPIDLAGAVVLVTGGGRGIGRATGALFRECGATVCLADLDLPAAEEVAHDVGVHAYGVDVADRTSFAAASRRSPAGSGGSTCWSTTRA